MRLNSLGALALATRSAMAFLNTSPFFMFSTSTELRLNFTNQIQSSIAVTQDIQNAISKCPSEYYIIVDQAGVSSSDYQNSKIMPSLASHLSQTADSSNVKSRTVISELTDQPDIALWKKTMSSKCHAKALHIDASTGSIPSLKSHKLISVTFSAPSTSEDLSKNDAYLASLLDLLPSQDYTVFYTTSSRSQKQPASSIGGGELLKEYEMESPLVEIMHQDLKRDLGSHTAAKKHSNQTMIDGPLFDKYQFFGPGIFMGFTIGIFLLFLLYIGISALASLQVSYGAFEKDSGPLANKKAQ